MNLSKDLEPTTVKLIAWTGLLVSLGCSGWISVGGPYVSRENSFQVELPAGWKRILVTQGGLTITRDGLPLQVIKILRTPFNELLYTAGKLEKGMLPQQVAEIVIDNLRSNQEISNFELSENQPATVGGYPGFKISFTYLTKEHLRKQGIWYGALVDDYFYRLLLEAPARYYFTRDLPVLERIRETFKITL